MTAKPQSRLSIAIHLFVGATFSLSFCQHDISSGQIPINKAPFSNEYIQKRILNFADKEFFSIDSDGLSARRNELLDLNYLGIAINGPQKIFCDKQEVLPIVCAIRVSGERDWRVSLKKNCYTVAANLTNGQVTIAKTFIDPKENKAFEDESPEQGQLPPGLSIAAAELTIIDVRKQIAVAWTKGLWSISVIYYDWVSNAINLQLVGGEGNGASPSVVMHEVNPKPHNSEIISG